MLVSLGENRTFESLRSLPIKGISQVHASHTRLVVSALFDDSTLVLAVGLVPIMKFGEDAGLP
jgi:hypothetical protein